MAGRQGCTVYRRAISIGGAVLDGGVCRFVSFPLHTELAGSGQFLDVANVGAGVIDKHLTVFGLDGRRGAEHVVDHRRVRRCAGATEIAGKYAGCCGHLAAGQNPGGVPDDAVVGK